MNKDVQDHQPANARSTVGDTCDEDAMADIELNLTGLKCPLPVLKARRQINSMAPASRLKVMADDPAAPLDFEHFCNTGGHHLVSTTEHSGVFTFLIVKVAD